MPRLAPGPWPLQVVSKRALAPELVSLGVIPTLSRLTERCSPRADAHTQPL